MALIKEKYPREQLVWLARRISTDLKAHGKSERNLVLTEFNATFRGVGLTIGKLARLYRDHGGDQAKFVTRYEVAEQDDAAKRDAIIGQAFEDWNPGRASFATAYALAAKRVNERLGSSYKADQIRAIVQDAGGVREFLCDCGHDAATAQRIFERVKQDRIT